MPQPDEQVTPTPPKAEDAPSEPLPPWAAVGNDFFGNKDWRIESVVGNWLELAEKRSRTTPPGKAWIYLPTGVVYGSTTLMRRSEHATPVITR